MTPLAPAVLALLLGVPPAGSKSEGPAWRVEIATPETPGPGATGTARVTVTALPPYHVNRDYPMSFRPDAASTATFSGPRVALGDGATRTPCADAPAESCAVAVPLPFAAPRSGPVVLAGTVAFSVCNPDRCLIEKVALTATAGPASSPRR